MYIEQVPAPSAALPETLSNQGDEPVVGVRIPAAEKAECFQSSNEAADDDNASR